MMSRFKEIIKEPIAQIALAFILGFTMVSLSSQTNPGYGFFDGFWPVLVGAIIYILFLAEANATHDAKMIAEKKWINHFGRFAVRTAVAMLFSFGALREFSWLGSSLTLFQGAIFWIYFDPALSIKRGRKWDYVSTWYGSSWLDKIFKGNKYLWLATKLTILIISLILIKCSG